MKNKSMRNAGIILAVLMILAAVGGIMGFVASNKAASNVASPFTQFTADFNSYKTECEGYAAQGEKALENIGLYSQQIVANAEQLKALGGDDSELLAANEEVLASLASAQKELDSIKGRVDKIAELGQVSEDTDQETLDSQMSKIIKQCSVAKSTLRKITKIDESESQKSFETIAQKASLQSAEAVKTAFPDAELGEQFVAEPYVAEVKEAVSEDAGFEGFLIKSRDYLLWLAGCLLFAAALCIIGWQKPELLKKIGGIANKNMMLVALIVITLIFFVLTKYTLLTPNNVSNIVNQNAYIIILACGMLLCIVCSGNIDLSVGRVIGFIAACAAKFMIEGDMPTIPGIILCLLIGVAIGAWQGFWIAYVRIPAFIVTLAGQLTFYGLTMKILQGFTISNFPSDFQAIFCSFLPDPFGGKILGINVGINVLAMLVGILAAAAVIFLQFRNRAMRKRKGYKLESLAVTWVRSALISVVVLWLFYSLSQAKGIPSVLFTVGIVLLIYAYLTGKTVMGRHLYAMGGNVNAARLSGVKTQKMLFLAYVNMGLLAALAGLVYAARLNAASPQAGQGDELYAIASCYIGGASAYGGIGTVGGTLIGALTMGVIKNGMSIMGLGQDIQQIVLGLVLLVAVVIDVVSKQKIKLPFFSGLSLKRKGKTGDGQVKLSR